MICSEFSLYLTFYLIEKVNSTPMRLDKANSFFEQM